jgi:hypothetical protein
MTCNHRPEGATHCAKKLRKGKRPQARKLSSAILRVTNPVPGGQSPGALRPFWHPGNVDGSFRPMGDLLTDRELIVYFCLLRVVPRLANRPRFAEIVELAGMLHARNCSRHTYGVG